MLDVLAGGGTALAAPRVGEFGGAQGEQLLAVALLMLVGGVRGQGLLLRAGEVRSGAAAAVIDVSVPHTTASSATGKASWTWRCSVGRRTARWNHRPHFSSPIEYAYSIHADSPG